VDLSLITLNNGQRRLSTGVIDVAEKKSLYVVIWGAEQDRGVEVLTPEAKLRRMATMLPSLRGLGRHSLRDRKVDVVKTDVPLLEEAPLIPLRYVVVPVGRHAPQLSLSP